ncbi:MAG: hypothetical protein A2Z88_01510 [Omnitrophica WOR_2 bacterium GWA2_47_8]|nr:MAG: hypothetical protein A2Z88_01510 [Omnitrophica WOR_2 bacterium GWA2_47_8]
MNKKISISFVVGIIAIIIFYITFFIQPYSLLRIIKGRKGYAVYLIQKAGIEAINQEAERMFDDFYKRNVSIYSPENPAQYEFISNLAFSTILGISRANENIQAHVRIKYGSHQMADFIYIFDRRILPPYFDNSKHKNLWRITDNIYLDSGDSAL